MKKPNKNLYLDQSTLKENVKDRGVFFGAQIK